MVSNHVTARPGRGVLYVVHGVKRIADVSTSCLSGKDCTGEGVPTDGNKAYQAKVWPSGKMDPLSYGCTARSKRASDAVAAVIGPASWATGKGV
jgi:hypothetical protein